MKTKIAKLFTVLFLFSISLLLLNCEKEEVLNTQIKNNDSYLLRDVSENDLKDNYHWKIKCKVRINYIIKTISQIVGRF